MVEPLVPDPARQAVPSLRGYRYQILRSIHEWLQLKDGEVIYLEGAEDIDRVSSSAASALQVKDTRGSGNVTLRSQAIRDSINNYWFLKQRNPGRSIHYHYLTTSGAGIEASEPFGTGKSGLTIWNEARITPDDSLAGQRCDEIRRFLLAEGNLHSSVLFFLRNARVDEVLAQLIRAVSWYCNEPSGEEVEAAALRILETECWHRKLPLPYSRKVLSRLEQDAWRKATSPEGRSLTVDDFRRAFDEETTVAVPHATLVALAQQDSGFDTSAFSLPTAEHLSIIGGASRTGAPPPIPPDVLARPTVISAIESLLAANSFAFIQGATGTGKTTQAAQYTSLHAGDWLWLSCRNADDSQLRIALTQAGRWLDRAPAQKQIVLDDLSFESQLGALEAQLPGLLYTLRTRQGSLIATGHHALPLRLARSLGLTAPVLHQVPHFTEDEISRYLETRGLSDATRKSTWSRIILLRTQGHPQLAVALASALAEASFPLPSQQDLIETPNPIREIQDEARLLLAGRLPAEQRDFLYRLSLLVGRFTRESALRVASIPPAIGRAGDAFDRLVGPWIERASESEYTASPLIYSAGQAANGDSWAKVMHGEIARAWVNNKSQTPWTIAAILFHSVLGNSGSAVVQLFAGLHDADPNIWDALASTDTVFTQVYLEKSPGFPEWNPMERFAARLLQLRLASRDRLDVIPLLLARIDQEFPSGVEDPPKALMRQMLLAQVMNIPKAPIPIRRVISMGKEIAQIAKGLPDQHDGLTLHVPSEDEIFGKDGRFDTTPAIGLAVVQRVQTIEDVRETIAALDELDPELRYRALAVLRVHGDMGRLMADSAWLSEHQSTSPRWTDLVVALRELYEAALKWRQDAFAAGVAGVWARTLHENLQQTELALEVLTTSLDRFNESRLLLDVKAKILLDTGNVTEALDIWERILPSWELDANANIAGIAFSYRSAAIAAAKSDTWPKAVYLFEKGVSCARKAIDRLFLIGLLADTAYANWRIGERAKAVALFCEALAQLENVPNISSDLRSFYLHKVIGHVLTFVSASKTQRPNALDLPIPGCCSNLDPKEEVSQLNPTPVEFSWANALVISDDSLELNAELKKRLPGLRASDFPAVRMLVTKYEIDRAIARAELDGFPRKVEALLTALALLKAQEKSGGQLWEKHVLPQLNATALQGGDDMRLIFLCRALFSAVGERRAIAHTLASWKVDIEPGTAAQWRDFCEASIALSHRELLLLVREGTDHWAWRLGGAALLLSRPEIDPRALLTVHMVLLITAQTSVGAQIEAEVSRAIASVWIAAASNRFALISPGLTAPLILEVCALPGFGWSKTARIFLAAHAAVDLAVSADVLSSIRKLVR